MALTARQLLEPLQASLDLRWQTPPATRERPLDVERLRAAGGDAVGYLNPVRPSPIQVLGETELAYLDRLGANSRHDAIERILQEPTEILIVSGDRLLPADLQSRAEAAGLPVLTSSHSADDILETLRHALTRRLAARQTQHGVFMEVMGLGVLLTGPSGVGKSELALELLGRGHRLVADDAPEFRRTGPDAVHGYCPPLLADFIEVRGLGILNVRAMYGDHAVLEHKRLHLIIDLQPEEETAASPIERLGQRDRHREVLGVPIPEVCLVLAPGRDLSVLIEAAVRNHVLRLSGYNAAEDFMQRQRQAMHKPES